MIEVPAAAELADQLAPLVDFFSIGTNDLTQYTLGLDRAGAREAAPHHPAVLRLIDRTVRAAHSARILVDVCGEAASQPIAMPLLLGLGVDELSVGTARLGIVRAWVRSLESGALTGLARRALECRSPGEVESLIRPQADLLEGVERGAESVEGGVGVLPLSAQA
jgi:phosphoenolpyruvate-protein kinase (PTS system EI component)